MCVACTIVIKKRLLRAVTRRISFQEEAARKQKEESSVLGVR